MNSLIERGYRAGQRIEIRLCGTIEKCEVKKDDRIQINITLEYDGEKLRKFGDLFERSPDMIFSYIVPEPTPEEKEKKGQLNLSFQAPEKPLGIVIDPDSTIAVHRTNPEGQGNE